MKSKKQLLIIGDSCAVPRKEISYENTYPAILKNIQSEYDVINTSIYGNNVNNVYNNKFKFYSYYSPKALIIHLGIVDAFPRPYPQNSFVLRFEKTIGKIDRLLKKLGLYYYLGNVFNFKITKLKKYSENIEEIIKDINAEKVILIGIVKPSKILLKSRIFEKEVEKYNFELKKISEKLGLNLIPMNHLDESYTIWDGFHLSQKASQYIAEEIKKILTQN